MSFVIREIEDADLPAVIDLLTEGFPARTRSYWQVGMAALDQRPRIEPYPRFGYLLIADGAPQGVILLITARFGEAVRSNLSSWYVRPAYRNLATFLFQRSLKTRGGVFLNLSPAPHVMPIVTAFGFKSYTGGMYLLGPSALLHRASGRVRPWRSGIAAGPGEEAAADLARHRAYGCEALLVEDEEGIMPALYRVRKIRGLVPVASFLWGSPARLIAQRGGVMRHLAPRGLLAAFIDAPEGAAQPGARLFPDKGVRYRKGNGEIAAGDLRETELAIFGQ